MTSRSPVYVSVFLVGFCGLVAQVVVVREMVVTFYGNELSIGVILGSWLLWTGLGSLGLGRLAVKAKRPRQRLAGALLLGALLLVGTVAGARALKILIGLPGGEVAGFLAHPLRAMGGIFSFLAHPASTLDGLAAAREAAAGEIRPFRLMLASSLWLLGPFCLVNGFLFPMACRAAGEGGDEGSTGRVYLLEAAGAAVGGAVYSFALVQWVNPLALAFALAGAWCLAAGWLALGAGRRWASRTQLAIGACGAGLVAVALAAGWPSALARETERAYWSPFRLVSSADSRYGRVAVVAPSQASPQRSLYHNGTLAFSYPDPPVAEAVAHLPMLEHPDPRTVLLLGGGLSGAIEEVLKYPSVTKMTYVELDPLVLRAVRERFAAAARAMLADPRVEVAEADGRAFLKRTRERYDVIIDAEAPPASAQANRFYTLEFFREAARALEPGGVFALRAAGGFNYIPEGNRRLIASLHASLLEVFPAVAVLPGEMCTFFASNRAGVVTDDARELYARLQRAGIVTLHLEGILSDALPEVRHRELADIFASDPTPPLNRDLSPRCYYFEAQRWSARQRTRLPGARLPLVDLGRFLEYFQRRPAVAPLAVLGVLGAASLLVPLLRRRGRDGALAFAVASTGLVEMAVEFVVLLGFQVVYGYVYQYVGILVASFMLGLALGAWVSGKWVSRGVASWRRLMWVQLLICAYPLALLGFLLLAVESGLAAGLAGPAFTLMALAAGLVGGLQFPVAAALHSGGGSSAGTLYGLDLFGSCLGAIAVSSVLVPTFGLLWVCGMLAGLGALGLAGLLVAGREAKTG